MLKLIIAEDEVIERKSIRFILSKYFDGKIEVAGEAVNGKEAVDKALDIKPDIILMDISMPEMDGLKASEEVKKQLPECEIIILTAYGHFEYAKKSIEIGVTDYLVKPYSNEDFCKSIERISQKVNHRNQENSSLTLLKSQKERLSRYIEREMIMELVHSREISEDRLKQFKDILGIQNETFTCLIFRAAGEEKFNDSVTLKVLENYKKITPKVICFSFLNELVLFLFADDIETKLNNPNFQEINQYVQNELKESNGLSTMIRYSTVYKDVTKINESYKESKHSFHRNSLLINEELYTQKPNLYKKETILCEKIMGVEMGESLSLLHEIIEEIKNKGEIEQIKSYAQQLCILIERSVIQFYDGYFNLKDVEKVLQEIEQINSVKEVEFYLEEMVTEVILSIKEQKQGQHNLMIEKVKSYLQENYKDYGISLNQTADYIGVSSFYLSRSFKKQEGITFKEYLTKIRMEQAIYHMQEGKKAIQDIALEIGFTDPNYFSKAFRKYVGVSPREYVQTLKR